MEGLDYVNMTNFSYPLLPMIEDLKLYVSLALMVGYESNQSYFDIMISLVIYSNFYWIILMVCLFFNSFEFFPILQSFSNWFVIAVPIHPSNDTFTLT